MVALLAPACAQARTLGEKSPTFQALEDAVEEYLRSTSGSGLEVPPWLRTLEEELNRVQRLEDRSSIPDAEGELQLPECPLNLRDMRQQLRQWREPLLGRKKR
jgi:hypothetical protein